MALTDKSAVIGWTTDRPATSGIIIHDEDNNVCIDIPVDEAHVTDHHVKVDGLNLGTSYRFRVLSAFNFENQSRSGKHSFSTLNIDVSPPVIWLVGVSNIGETSAIIEWKTDEPATSQVDYMITDTESPIIIFNDELTTDHKIGLSDLEPGTSYGIQIKSQDAVGNEATLRVSMLETLPAVPVGHEVGNRAPDFTLQNIDGESVTLSDFRGRVVMLHFWLAGCQVCIDEMPHIQAVFDKSSAEDLVILAVHVGGHTEVVQKFVEREELTFPVLLDLKGVVDEAYRVPYFPTSYFINAEGMIGRIKEGSFNSLDEIHRIVSLVIADSK
jgi:peroxiredoxin